MRNKIYLTKNIPQSQQEQCCTVDVGKVLANVYKNNPQEFTKEAKFDSFAYFRKIIDSIIKENQTRIVFSNIGILLESEFKLDVSQFLLAYAKDYQFFILIDTFNLVDGNKLVWQVENPKDKIEFSTGVLEILSE